MIASCCGRVRATVGGTSPGEEPTEPEGKQAQKQHNIVPASVVDCSLETGVRPNRSSLLLLVMVFSTATENKINKVIMVKKRRETIRIWSALDNI